MKLSIWVSNYFALLKAINRLDRKKNEIILHPTPGTVHSVTLSLIDERACAVIKVIEDGICTVTLWDSMGEYYTGLEITKDNIKDSAKKIVDYLHSPTKAV